MTDDELRKLLAEATRGPWGWKQDEDGVVQWRLTPGVLLVEPGITDGTPAGDGIDCANACLIAAAPDLAAEVLRLRETEATLRAEVARLLKAANQSRLAFAGYVSAHSAIDMLDAALGDKEASHDIANTLKTHPGDNS
jgi:hypothetical protein